MTDVIRVLLADDHAPTRADVGDALEADERFMVVAEAADAAGAVSRALRLRPDVCVLDLNMPGSGVAAAWEILSRLPKTKVVMLTVSDEDEHVRSALRAGAASSPVSSRTTATEAAVGAGCSRTTSVHS